MASHPLLEASTPEEARALAHAHYGPEARVDVRKVRSGGVLGFFATQRYVADLATNLDEALAADASVSTSTEDDAASEPTARVAGRDVSGHADTATREHDTNLEAAIAEASQTLGLPMSSPTHPVSSVPAGLLRDHSFDQPSERHRGEPPTSEVSVETTAKTPASPFAAALSRVTTEPVVTEAVMNVLDHTSTPSGDTVTQALLSTDMPELAFYSVPFPQSVPETPDPTRAEPTAVVPPAEPQINYAAALVASRSRNPLFPQPPTPSLAPAPTPGAAQAQTVEIPTGPVSTREVPTVDGAAPMQATHTPPAPDLAVGPASHASLTTPEMPPVSTTASTPATALTTAMAAFIPHASDPTGLLPRLDAAGFPVNRIPDLFLHEVGEKGIHTALTRLIKMRTSPAPALPVAPCTVVLIGPGTEALTAAMNACGALRADASQVAWVGPAHLSNLVPRARRISTPEAATEWLAAPKRATVVNVIAVHAPVSDNIDPHTRAMIAALDPTMVLAVVDATRRSDAVTRWVEALDCVDAIALENASDTPDPAIWLTLPAAPVALVEGRKATAARWASLLCERLTDLTDLTDVEV